MILNSKTGVPVETSQEFQEVSFGVREQDMGLILEILRSKMYRNPIGSIAREISSNSRDANREAENLAPITISIIDSPLSASDKAIAFKDEGVGISQQRMADVFVNYGASTKRNSNELTGGFGLGAKTPFSYADSFVIETIYDEVKYVYVAAIEEQSRGKIYLLSREETEQRNGTTIIVPIKDDDDRDTFEKEVYRATSFWDLKPNYVNFRSSYKHKVVYEHGNCAIVEHEGYNHLLTNNVYALVDGIVYDIDSNSVKIQGYERATILIKFNVGEVSVSANREALRYDSATSDKIVKRYNEFINHLESCLRKEIEQATNYLEACIRYYTLYNERGVDSKYPYFHSIVSNVKHTQLEFKWNEFDVDYRVSLKACRFRIITKTISSEKNIWDEYFLSSPIYLLDRSLSALKNRTLLQDDKPFLVIELDDKELIHWKTLPYSRKKQKLNRMKNLIADLERLKTIGLKWSKYSEVPNTRVPRQKTNKDVVPVGFVTLPIRVLRAKTLTFSADSLRVRTGLMYLLSEGDKKDKFVYCVLNSLSSEEYLNSPEVKQKICWAKIVQAFAKSRVVFVNKKNVGHVRKLKTLEEAIRSIPRRKLQKLTNQEFVDSKHYDLSRQFTFGSEITKELERYRNYSREVRSDKQKRKRFPSLNLPEGFEKRFPVEERLFQMDQTIQTIYAKYPLLEFVRHTHQVPVDEVNRYIRLIDQELQSVKKNSL
jgi:hypothetical protein